MAIIFNEEDKKKLAVTGKVGLISSIDEDNYPRIAIISTIETKNNNELMWGEFCEGISKKNLLRNNKSAFFVINMEKECWHGLGEQTSVTNVGQDFDYMNNKPLFRYNTYFGIGKVHYMKLNCFSGKYNLDMKSIIKGVLKGKFVKPFVKKSENKDIKIFNLSYDLIKGVATLKFLSFVNKEGYPIILPVLQATIIDKCGRIIIPLDDNLKEMNNLKENTKIALYNANMELSSVLFQGVFKKVESKFKIKYAIIDIEKVYNSMVPICGYVNPEQDYSLIY